MDRRLRAKGIKLWTMRDEAACLILSDEIFAQLPKQWLMQDFKLTQTLFMTFPPQEWHLHMFKYARPHLPPH